MTEPWLLHPYMPPIDYTADERLNNYAIYGPGTLVTGRRIWAYADEVNVGNLILSPEGIHLLLWVHPDYRRRGIATTMFEMAKEQGWKPIRGASGYSKDAAEWADVMNWED
jgi:GNAT superfamily N-acetyltransferase